MPILSKLTTGSELDLNWDQQPTSKTFRTVQEPSHEEDCITRSGTDRLGRGLTLVLGAFIAIEATGDSSIPATRTIVAGTASPAAVTTPPKSVADIPTGERVLKRGAAAQIC